MKEILKKLRRIEYKKNNSFKGNNENKDKATKYSLIAALASLASVIIMAGTYYSQYIDKSFDVVVGVNKIDIKNDSIFCDLHFSNIGNQNMTINFCKLFYSYDYIDISKTFTEGVSFVGFGNDLLEKSFVLPPNQNYLYSLEQQYKYSDIINVVDLKKQKEKGKNSFDTRVIFLDLEMYLLIEYYEMGQLKYHFQRIGEIDVQYDVFLSSLDVSTPKYISKLHYMPQTFELKPLVSFSKNGITIERNE